MIYAKDWDTAKNLATGLPLALRACFAAGDDWVTVETPEQFRREFVAAIGRSPTGEVAVSQPAALLPARP